MNIKGGEDGNIYEHEERTQQDILGNSELLVRHRKGGESTDNFKFEGRLPDGMAGVDALNAALKEQGWILKSVGCNEKRDIWAYELGRTV